MPGSNPNNFGTAGTKRIVGIGLTSATFPVNFLILGFDGKVWKDQDNVTPIFTLAAGSDICVLVHGTRIYFSGTPVVGPASVWVYDATTGAAVRAAAGVKPLGTFTVAVSATVGNVEPGQHIYAVSYETATGYITKPNLYVSLTSPAVKKCTDLTVIPTGPAGTVARHILMSRVLKNWDGNLGNPELFFALRIADNTTVALAGLNAINKFDTELVSSADYLKDLVEELPRANSMCLYKSRAVHVGGASTNPVRLSEPADVETFLATEGYLKQYPRDSNVETQACAELNGVLYVFKSTASFATSDTGESPTRWPVANIHSALGCFTLGVAKVATGAVGGSKILLILNQAGIYIFDGAYHDIPISYKIGGKFFDQVELAGSSIVGIVSLSDWSIVVDDINKLIYVFCPVTTSELNNYANDQIFVGDYSRGLDWQATRWVSWSYKYMLQCMAQVPADNRLPSLVLGFGNAAQTVPSLISFKRTAFPERDDLPFSSAVGIPWKFRSGSLGFDNEGGTTAAEALSCRAGIYKTPVSTPWPILGRIQNVETGVWTNIPNLTFVSSPTDVQDIVPVTEITKFNVSAERLRIELSGTVGAVPPGPSGGGHRIENITLYGTVLAEEVPA